MRSVCTFLLFCSVITLIETSLRFTNIKCEPLSPDFVTFEKCILKVIRRGVISLNMHAKLLQVPVTNITINLSLHQKLSGYRPFLYNYTLDYCHFLLNRKRYPFVKLFFDSTNPYSNTNHTCPYNHDIIVDNMILEENMFKYLPLPHGDYMIQMKVAAYNDWKAVVTTYIAVNSDFGGK